MKNEAEEEEDKKNKKTKRGRKGTIWSLLSQRKEKPFADPPKDSSNSSPFSPPLNNSSDKQIQRDLINQLQNFQKSSNKLRSVNDEGNKQIFSTAQTSLKSNFEAFENEKEGKKREVLRKSYSEGNFRYHKAVYSLIHRLDYETCNLSSSLPQETTEIKEKNEKETKEEEEEDKLTAGNQKEYSQYITNNQLTHQRYFTWKKSSNYHVQLADLLNFPFYNQKICEIIHHHHSSFFNPFDNNINNNDNNNINNDSKIIISENNDNNLNNNNNIINNNNINNNNANQNNNNNNNINNNLSNNNNTLSGIFNNNLNNNNENNKNNEKEIKEEGRKKVVLATGEVLYSPISPRSMRKISPSPISPSPLNQSIPFHSHSDDPSSSSSSSGGKLDVRKDHRRRSNTGNSSIGSNININNNINNNNNSGGMTSPPPYNPSNKAKSGKRGTTWFSQAPMVQSDAMIFTLKPIKEGFLFFKKKKRWVILTDTHLYIFKHIEDYKTPKEINLHCAAVRRISPSSSSSANSSVPSQSQSFSFEIFTAGQNYTFGGVEMGETEEWISNIQSICENLIISSIGGSKADSNLLTKTYSTLISKDDIIKAREEGGGVENNVVEQREVMKLVLIEGNRICADCNVKEPDWASINLGIFLCIECSGIHRSFGTHISKVRSVKLDKWEVDWVSFFKTMGNIRSNQIWESIVPPSLSHLKITDASNLEERKVWLKMKYVEGRFRKDFDESKLETKKNENQTNTTDEQKKINAQNKQLAEIRSLARSLRKEELKGFFIELLKEDEEFRKDVKDVLISLLLPPRPHPLHPSSSADHPADQSEEKSM